MAGYFFMAVSLPRFEATALGSALVCVRTGARRCRARRVCFGADILFLASTPLRSAALCFARSRFGRWSALSTANPSGSTRLQRVNAAALLASRSLWPAELVLVGHRASYRKSRYTPGGNLRSLSGRHWWRPGSASVALQSVTDSVPRTRTRCPHGDAENTGRTRASSSAVRTKLSEWRPQPDLMVAEGAAG